MKIEEGKNKFNFMIYGNFIVEPYVKEYQSQNYVLSEINYFNKVANLTTFCDPQGELGESYMGYSCAARIIYNEWKIDY